MNEYTLNENGMKYLDKILRKSLAIRALERYLAGGDPEANVEEIRIKANSNLAETLNSLELFYQDLIEQLDQEVLAILEDFDGYTMKLEIITPEYLRQRDIDPEVLLNKAINNSRLKDGFDFQSVKDLMATYIEEALYE